MKLSTLFAVAVFATASTAMACQPTPVTEAFGTHLDKNEDGQVSRHEWEKMRTAQSFERDFNRGSRKTFHELDADNNGKLSMDELSKLKGKISYKDDVECEPVPPAEMQ